MHEMRLRGIVVVIFIKTSIHWPLIRYQSFMGKTRPRSKQGYLSTYIRFHTKTLRENGKAYTFLFIYDDVSSLSSQSEMDTNINYICMLENFFLSFVFLL